MESAQRRRLQSYLEECRRRPLDYGRHDCARFAAGAVEVVTGHRLGTEYDYASLKEGLEQLPPGGLRGLAAAHLKEIPVPQAQIGDILFFDVADGGSLGVCTGPWASVVMTHGMGVLPTDRAAAAFRP